MEQNLTSFLALIGLIIVIILVFRGFNRHFSKRKMSKQEYLQAEINKRASEPNYYSKREKKGCGFWTIFFIVVILILLTLLITFITGNKDFHL